MNEMRCFVRKKASICENQWEKLWKLIEALIRHMHFMQQSFCEQKKSAKKVCAEQKWTKATRQILWACYIYHLYYYWQCARTNSKKIVFKEEKETQIRLIYMAKTTLTQNTLSRSQKAAIHNPKRVKERTVYRIEARQRRCLWHFFIIANF